MRIYTKTDIYRQVIDVALNKFLAPNRYATIWHSRRRWGMKICSGGKGANGSLREFHVKETQIKPSVRPEPVEGLLQRFDGV